MSDQSERKLVDFHHCRMMERVAYASGKRAKKKKEKRKEKEKRDPLRVGWLSLRLVSGAGDTRILLLLGKGKVAGPWFAVISGTIHTRPLVVADGTNVHRTARRDPIGNCDRLYNRRECNKETTRRKRERERERERKRDTEKERNTHRWKDGKRISIERVKFAEIGLRGVSRGKWISARCDKLQ